MWQEPKIDWNRESRFDKNDYNRIKNNLNYLKELSTNLYKDYIFEDMGGDRDYYDYIYAEDINMIEDNLERIKNNTFSPVIGNKKIYYPNQSFINFEELNRIERASLLFFENLTGQDSGRKRLAFVLNGGAF